MSKPLGYYTSYTPGDNSPLDALANTYGSRLEQISHREKLFLISSIASHICMFKPGECRNEIYKLSVSLLDLLQPEEIEGLLEALINQIRCEKDNEQQALHYAGSIPANRD